MGRGHREKTRGGDTERGHREGTRGGDIGRGHKERTQGGDTGCGHREGTWGGDTGSGQPRAQCVRRTVKDGQTSSATQGGVILGKSVLLHQVGEGRMSKWCLENCLFAQRKKSEALTLSQK